MILTFLVGYTMFLIDHEFAIPLTVMILAIMSTPFIIASDRTEY